MKITVLAVDDEETSRKYYEASIPRMGYETIIASSGDEALQILSEKTVDIMVTDLRMPGMHGIQLLEKARELQPELLSIVVTAYGTIDFAVEAMKLGAQDFISKPAGIDEMEVVIERSAELIRLRHENRILRDDEHNHYYELVGKTPQMMELYGLIESTARAKSTVLISGESGTGKELVARAVHKASERCNNLLIRVNCAALPKDLVEAELFGYEKGAFTGADKQRKGHFEAAHGSTLLLDEISEIPIGIQAKLLRVLQEKEIIRLGSTTPIPINVRVIATSNRVLTEEIAKGTFREDLYYRLNVIPIKLPPLRDRQDDIPLLVNHFIGLYNAENGRQVERIDENILRVFKKYHWPGNIRELSNLIERAVVTSGADILTADNFPPEIAYGRHADEQVSLEPGMSLAEGEKVLILKTLKKYNGNKTRAAESLQVTPRTIRNKLAEYQITAEDN